MVYTHTTITLPRKGGSAAWVETIGSTHANLISSRTYLQGAKHLNEHEHFPVLRRAGLSVAIDMIYLVYLSVF